MSDETTETVEETLRVSDEVNQKLNAYRQRANSLRLEIGGLEITKVRLIGELGNMENAAQAILQEEGARLGIPADSAWTVEPDGTVRVRPSQG